MTNDQNMPCPVEMPGHWTTPQGKSIADEYLSKSRDDLAHGAMSDMELANRIFMADRNDLDLIAWQTAAKQRIRWLSAHLAAARAALEGK